MEPARELGKLLLLCAVVLGIAGVLLMVGGKLPMRMGRLPGDIAYRGKNGAFYFPMVTCLLLSAGLTLLFWLFNWLRR